MWGRKDQEQMGGSAPDAAPGPTPNPAQPRPPAPNPAMAQQPPTRVTDQPRVAASSQIGKTVRYKGDIFCEEDLFVDGIIEGKVEIPKHMLVIGAKSQVNAKIHARSLVIHGVLKGEVKAEERIEIKKTGSFEGNLVTDRLVIEDGGVFRGHSETRPPKAAAPAPAPAPAKAAAPAQQPSAPAPKPPAPAPAPAPRPPAQEAAASAPSPRPTQTGTS